MKLNLAKVPFASQQHFDLEGKGSTMKSADLTNLTTKMELALSKGLYNQASFVAATIANQFYLQQKYELALLYYKKQLEVLRSSDGASSQQVPLMNIASVYYTTNDFEKAESWYNRAAKVPRKLTEKHQIDIFEKNKVNVLYNLALIARLLGHVENAIINATGVVKADANHVDLDIKVSALCVLVSCCTERKQIDESIFYATAAVEASQKLNNLELLVRVNNNMGMCLFEKKRFLDAIKFFCQAYSNAVNVKNDKEAIAIKYNLGLAYAAVENTEEASQCFNMCINTLIKTPDHIKDKNSCEILSSSYNQLSLLSFQQDDVYSAENFQREAEKYITELVSPLVASQLHSLSGNISLSSMDYDNAIQKHTADLQLSQINEITSGQIRSRRNLGITYRLRLQYKEAVEEYRAFVKLAVVDGDKLELAIAYGGLGLALVEYNSNLEDTSEIENPLQYFQRQLTLSSEVGDQMYEALAHRNLATEFNRTKDFQNAIEHCEKYLSILNGNESRNPENICDGYKMLSTFLSAQIVNIVDGENGMVPSGEVSELMFRRDKAWQSYKEAKCKIEDINAYSLTWNTSPHQDAQSNSIWLHPVSSITK